MTNPSAEQTAIKIVNAFMDTQFDEEAEASIWLIRRIAAAIEEAEGRGMEASAVNDNRRSGGP
jgi:hypothetical protein